MIDVEAIRTRFDCRQVIERDLKQAPERHSGATCQWWCPFHPDGQKHHKRHERTPSLTAWVDGWKCYGCDARGDVIGWVMRFHNLSFREACDQLMGGDLPTLTGPRPKRMAAPMKQPPGATWQEMARAFVDACEARIWTPAGDGARAYLNGRGIDDDSIRLWRLGFHIIGDGKRWGHEPVEKWGLSAERYPEGVSMPGRAITIPGFIGGQLWFVRFRHPWASRYLHLSGGEPALFGVNHMAALPDLILCEGELDTILVRQHVGDMADVVTLGSASENDIRSWLPALIGAKRLWVGLDTDSGSEKAVVRWMERTKRARRLAPPIEPPNGKDFGDAWKAGVDIRAYISEKIGTMDFDLTQPMAWEREAA